MSKSLETHIVVPDTHRPFHDERAEEVVHRVIEVIKPDEIDLMGDYADFFDISNFPKPPDRKHNLKSEVASVRRGLRVFEGHGVKRLNFITGNHERRLARYLGEKAPELYGLVDLETLLGLEKWTVTPYNDHHIVGKFHLTHDCGYYGRRAHEQSRDAYEGNVGMGHNHTLAVSYKSNLKRSTHVGISFGWLGDVEQVDYLHRARAAAWTLGFGVLTHEKKTGLVFAQAIPIIDYTAIVNGNLVRVPKKRTYAKAA